MRVSPETRVGLVLLAGAVALAAGVGLLASPRRTGQVVVLAGASWCCGWMLRSLKGEWT